MPITQRICLIACIVALMACESGRDRLIGVSPVDPKIRYTGRWNFDTPTGPTVGWQGSTVSVHFRGSAITAELDVGDKEERLRVIVDGVPEEPATTVTPGRQRLALADGLDPDAAHTLVLMKETYAGSALTFYGFEIAGSDLLDLPPRPTMRIAFFGDSNMEGYSLYSEKDNGAIGTYYAYPATVARMLGAEMQLQARGSATLDGPTGNDVVSFVYSETYGQQDPDYRDAVDPQLIVVNAGANDIYRVEAADRKTALKANYRSVVNALREVYGDEPHIIFYNAYSWDLDEPANYSHEIVDEVGGSLSTLLFPWCWEQWHGDMVDHAGQARRLAQYIESLQLGFELRQDAEVVSGYGRGFDVANGSFEGGARDGYGGFGWRYFEDGVERVRDAGGAANGEFFIRLEPGELVHQCVDATGDFEPGPTRDAQQYLVTASIRSAGDSGEAIISADFEEQALYRRANPIQRRFSVTGQWRDYAAQFTAPDGTWKVYVGLESAAGSVEFDNIRMTAQ